MVAVIKTGTSLTRILNYNENKVSEGVATRIAAVNYARGIEQMGFKDKLRRLEKLSTLNPKVTRNSVHVSLNFDPTEKLSKTQLEQIARRYMEGIGFGEQPYLVYEHRDAGHPHIHIVSVKVRSDGSRIDMHNIGKNQSEKVRQEIERAFRLVPAKREKRSPPLPLKPVPVAPIEYGKKETRKAISAVLQQVVPHFNYTSLAELNAVLRLYHVEASTGNPDSKMARLGGLQYRIIDRAGNPVGIPIKASAFAGRPTLRFLNTQFEKNRATRTALRASLLTVINRALTASLVHSMSDMAAVLAKEGILMIERRGQENILYGLTYVDLNSRSVFNGSELGKGFTAAGMQARLPGESAPKTGTPVPSMSVHHRAGIHFSDRVVTDLAQLPEHLLALLFQEERARQAIPSELKKPPAKRIKPRQF